MAVIVSCKLVCCVPTGWSPLTWPSGPDQQALSILQSVWQCPRSLNVLTLCSVHNWCLRHSTSLQEPAVADALGQSTEAELRTPLPFSLASRGCPPPPEAEHSTGAHAHPESPGRESKLVGGGRAHRHRNLALCKHSRSKTRWPVPQWAEPPRLPRDCHGSRGPTCQLGTF